MIKEAIEYLAGLQTPKNPVTVELHGHPYQVKADGTLGGVVLMPNTHIQKPTLLVSTLGAIVAAVKAQLDGLDQAKVAIQVDGPHTVSVVDLTGDEFGNRHVYARADYKSQENFKFGEFMAPEDFLLKFRANFLYNDAAVNVQKLCSTVTAGMSVAVADDGISQQVTVTAGTVTKVPITLPAEGVPLIPWRTFRDAAPVESKFLLRMKGVKDDLPKIALFEIDAHWSLDTVNSIKSYFEKNLPGAIIIA